MVRKSIVNLNSHIDQIFFYLNASSAISVQCAHPHTTKTDRLKYRKWPGYICFVRS